MSDFQEKLNDEIEKRGEEEIAPPSDKNKLSRKASFSFSTFLIGLLLESLVLGGLIAWAQFTSQETTQNLQKRLASKTTIVEVSESPVYVLGENNQPIIKMPTATDVGEEEAAIHALIKENTGGTHHAEIEQEELLPPSHVKNHNNGKPRLSIVVTDLGLSKKTTDEIIKKLPKEVSLGFSPYTKNLSQVVDSAKGHELWMMLPLQPENFPLIDPGPLTLLTSASVTQNTDRADHILTLAQGMKGFIPNKGHAFKNEDANINPAIREIFEKGFAVLDSQNSAQSFVDDLAYKNDYPYGKNNFWLDENLSPVALDQRIRQIVEFGEAYGSVTVMLRPYPASITALEKFLNSKEAQKFNLTPASASLKNAG